MSGQLDVQHNEGGSATKGISASETARVILGIETSCDECAAAVVSGAPGRAEILSDVILSQVDLHRHFGGVVPEIAARAHADTVDAVVLDALHKAGVDIKDVSCVAATVGPGLLGGLLVGATFGKALAAGADKPFAAVSHLEAHVLTPRLTDAVAFPYLVALLSGGHSQFVAVGGVGRYRRLGGTIDDAAGEAFDKTAKLLGLAYPGGPSVEKAAAAGNPDAFQFGLPLLKRPGCDLSFAGLKTAVRLAAQNAAPLSGGVVADICASFQKTVAAHLARAARRAVAEMTASGKAPSSFAVVGGVAANGVIRTALRAVADENGIPFVAPPLNLCTDNGAMVAYAAIETTLAGTAGDAFTRVRSRWPLDAAAPALIGAGKRGAKA